MRLYIFTAFFTIALAAARSIDVEGAADLDSRDSGPNASKALGTDLARFGSCMMQRSFFDIRRTQCGQYKTLGDCVCSDPQRLSTAIRQNLKVCVSEKTKFGSFIARVGNGMYFPKCRTRIFG